MGGAGGMAGLEGLMGGGMGGEGGGDDLKERVRAAWPECPWLEAAHAATRHSGGPTRLLRAALWAREGRPHRPALPLLGC